MSDLPETEIVFSFSSKLSPAMKYLQGLLVLQGLRIRYCVMVSMRNNQSNGAVECIRWDVPVCIAAGFSPENTKSIIKNFSN
mgnify:CR=1 FL=1